MRNLFQKLHIYAGLQTSVGLLVYAVTIIVASVRPPPTATRPERASQVLTVDVDGGQGSPKQVSRRIVERLGWSTSKPPWRLAEQDGVVSFYTQSPSAEREVSYNRRDKRATVKVTPQPLGEFMVAAHLELKLDPRKASVPLVLWSWFNVVSGLSLLFLVCSGVYLFFVAKKKPWYAWAAAGFASVALFLAVMGLQ